MENKRKVTPKDESEEKRAHISSPEPETKEEICDSTEPTDYTELENSNSISASLQDFQSRIGEFVVKYHDLFADILKHISEIKAETASYISELENEQDLLDKQLTFLTEKTLTLQKTIMGLLGKTNL